MTKKIIIVFLGALLAINGCFCNGKPRTASVRTLAIGREAPDFSLPLTDGSVLKLSNYRGKIIILDFWATWCGPCKMEIPGFINIMDKYSDRGVVIIGVSLDANLTMEQLAAFGRKMGINYQIGMPEDNEAISYQYGGIGSIPTTFTIDRQGRIRDKINGAMPQSYFENNIEIVLKEDAPVQN